MARISTDTADNTGSEVLFLGAVVLAMSNLATVLAGLVLVVSQGTVERSELSKLVALEFVLTFRNRCSSLNNVMNKLLGLVDLLFGISHDKTVQVFFLVAGVSGIRPALALLDGALATNGNLGTRISLHLL
jgi:hypothetical protein